MQSVTVGRWLLPKLYIPPPTSLAEFPSKLHSVTVGLLESLCIPPPLLRGLKSAEFSLNAQLVTVGLLEKLEEQSPGIEVVRIYPAGALQTGVEALALERREAGGVRDVDHDRIEYNRSVFENAIDDGLVLFGREGAGRVEDRAARAGKGDGSAEQSLLSPGRLSSEFGTLPPRLAALPA